MTHDRHNYPTGSFFIVHKRFTALEGKPWGDLLDGPQVDDEAVIECIYEAWKDEEHAPGRDDLRVWHIQPGKPAEDCTAWAIKTVKEYAQDVQDGVA